MSAKQKRQMREIVVQAGSTGLPDIVTGLVLFVHGSSYFNGHHCGITGMLNSSSQNEPVNGPTEETVAARGRFFLRHPAAG